jgi:hypothetical protein
MEKQAEAFTYEDKGEANDTPMVLTLSNIIDVIL